MLLSVFSYYTKGDIKTQVEKKPRNFITTPFGFYFGDFFIDFPFMSTLGDGFPIFKRLVICAEPSPVVIVGAKSIHIKLLALVLLSINTFYCRILTLAKLSHFNFAMTHLTNNICLNTKKIVYLT